MHASRTGKLVRKVGRLRVTRIALSALVATTLLLAVPATAFALTWTEGGSSSFMGTKTGVDMVTGAGKNTLLLPIKKTGSAIIPAAAGLWPTSIEPLSDGSVLVTDRKLRQVVELDPNGEPAWTFGSADLPLNEPYSATRAPDNTTIIVDRAGNRVLRVDKGGQLVWEYTDLKAPHSAQLLKNGNVLIADAGNNRVIEVSPSGTQGGTIEWKYGVKGKSSSKAGHLKYPTSAQRLDKNTLITDRNAHLVVEITPTDKVAWSFGTKDTSGSAINQLYLPVSAHRDSSGNTFIADNRNGRVIRVGSRGPQQLTGEFLDPQGVRVDAEGRIVVANTDTLAGAVYGFGFGTSGRYDTGSINMSAPGLRKKVTKIAVSASVPDKTDVVLQYSFDGGKWRTAKGLTVKFSGGRTCTYMRVRLNLTSSSIRSTPVVRSIAITYDLAATTGTNTGIGGVGGLGGTGTWLGPGTPGATGGSVGSGAAPIPKAGGSTTEMLPSGTEVELQGINTVHSGFVMNRVVSEMPGKGVSVNKPALAVDPVGVVTAGVLLSTVYGLGLAGPQLAQAASGAWSTLRDMIIGRTNG